MDWSTGGSMWSSSFFRAALLLFAVPAFAAPLDAKNSELVVRTWKEGTAAALAHNHVIRAGDAQGSISWDPAAPATSKVEVTVKVASLEVDDPALRRKYGETAVLDEGKRKKVTQAM